MRDKLKRLIVVLGVGAAAIAGGDTVVDFVSGLGLKKKQYYSDLKELCKINEPSCALIKWLHPRLKVPTECWAYMDEDKKTYDRFCREDRYYGPGAGGVTMEGKIIDCKRPPKGTKKLPVPCSGDSHLDGDIFQTMVKEDNKRLGFEILRSMASDSLGKELESTDAD